MKLLFFVFCFQVISFAQNGTEIYLLEIQKTSDGFKLENPINISNRTGYDNQPNFHPSKSLIYFSSQKNGQTDIWSYDYQSKKLSQTTNTEDSEYSPTVIPGENAISCIVQRKSNGDQDLVKISLENPKNTEIILESQKTGKIGYQAWSENKELVTFVLGEPNELHFFDLSDNKESTLAKNIGRSLHYITKRKAFSFVENENNTWKIKLLDPKTKKITTYTNGLENSENYNAWNKNGVLFGTKDKELYFFNEKDQKWKSIMLPIGIPKNKMSRLTLKDNLLAIVVEE